MSAISVGTPSVSRCLDVFLLPTAQLLLGTPAWLPPSMPGSKTLSGLVLIFQFVVCQPQNSAPEGQTCQPNQCSGCAVSGFQTVKNRPGNDSASPPAFSGPCLLQKQLVSLPLLSTPGIPLSKTRHCNPPCLSLPQALPAGPTHFQGIAFLAFWSSPPTPTLDIILPWLHPPPGFSPPLGPWDFTLFHPYSSQPLSAALLVPSGSPKNTLGP